MWARFEYPGRRRRKPTQELLLGARRDVIVPSWTKQMNSFLLSMDSVPQDLAAAAAKTSCADGPAPIHGGLFKAHRRVVLALNPRPVLNGAWSQRASSPGRRRQGQLRRLTLRGRSGIVHRTIVATKSASHIISRVHNRNVPVITSVDINTIQAAIR